MNLRGYWGMKPVTDEDFEALESVRRLLPTIKTNENAARMLSGAADELCRRLRRFLDPAWYVEIRYPDAAPRYEKRQWVTSTSWYDPKAVIHLARRPITRRCYRQKEREERTCLYEYVSAEVLPGNVIPLRREMIQ